MTSLLYNVSKMMLLYNFVEALYCSLNKRIYCAFIVHRFSFIIVELLVSCYLNFL